MRGAYGNVWYPRYSFNFNGAAVVASVDNRKNYYFRHCADLGNPTKSIKEYEKWVKRLLDEFWNQGDIEKSNGLPYSPMTNRHDTAVPVIQTEFINFVVQPLYNAFNHVFADPLLEKILEQLETNKAHYARQIEK